MQVALYDSSILAFNHSAAFHVVGSASLFLGEHLVRQEASSSMSADCSTAHHCCNPPVAILRTRFLAEAHLTMVQRLANGWGIQTRWAVCTLIPPISAGCFLIVPQQKARMFCKTQSVFALPRTTTGSEPFPLWIVTQSHALKCHCHRTSTKQVRKALAVQGKGLTGAKVFVLPVIRDQTPVEHLWEHCRADQCWSSFT